MFPADYQKRIFIAGHGSWNRDMPVEVENSTAIDHQVFASGWLQEGE